MSENGHDTVRLAAVQADSGRLNAEATALDRRDFLRVVGQTVGGLAFASALAPITSAFAQGTAQTAASSAIGKTPKAETLVKTLYDSLNEMQRGAVCMGWEHPKRSMVQANWGIVKTPIGKQFTADQKEMIRGILRGLTTEEWYPKIQSQMDNDAGGMDNYYAALFGSPGTGKFEFVLTGRHVTLRADGHSNQNAAFGGPIFYGHAVHETENPDHAGNIYWQQAQKANAVFTALDGKQRDKALLDHAPSEDKIKLQGAGGEFPGIAIGDLSRDQKALVKSVMHDLLSPYRPADAEEAMRDIAANGGLDKIFLSFYKQDDLGNDGVWDIWRLEGPSLVWHFRGAPHVHTWVNIAKDAKLSDARTS
jgi:hypothetical protein